MLVRRCGEVTVGSRRVMPRMVRRCGTRAMFFVVTKLRKYLEREQENR